MGTNFHGIDAGIILGYLAALTAIGVFFSRRQSSLDDFFLAGRGMGWLPVGLSLMAALNSGIDYLMGPSATIQYGLVLLLGTTSWLCIYPWVACVAVPFYRRLNCYSAYQYLEARFDVRVRALAAGIFLLWRLGWMATALYVPCLAVNAATQGRLPIVPMILVLGTVVTCYTMLGGMRAVIWTDVLQFCVMMGGLLGTVLIVANQTPGGVGEIWRVAQLQGSTDWWRPIAGMAEAGWWTKLKLFLVEPVTVPAILCAALVGRITLYTSDQVMVQRIQTTRSVMDSRRAFVINALGDALWMGGLAFVGLALAAYYAHGGSLPAQTPSDRIFPVFMAQVFPSGIIGLVIAAIFAASLSSVDSALNSCSTVLVVDFYQRFWRPSHAPSPNESAADPAAQIRVSRIATILLGLVGMALASQVSRLGSILEIANKAIQSFTGPLFGIFLLGMFSRRANSPGVLLGGLCGALLAAYVAFFSSIGFLWPSTFGFVTTFVVGYLGSVLQVPLAPAARPLTFRQVMSQSASDAPLPDLGAREMPGPGDSNRD